MTKAAEKTNIREFIDGARSREEHLLVKRCVEGDDYAWELLFRRYSPDVRATIHRYGWGLSREAREDLEQDVFLRITRYLPQFRFQSSLGTWIHRIVMSCCMTRHRRGERDRMTVSTDEAMENGAPGVLAAFSSRALDPAELMVIREIQVKLIRRLRGLDPLDRNLLFARLLEDDSYDGVAASHGITRQNAAVRAHRAWERIRGELAPLMGVTLSETADSQKIK